LAVEKQSVAQKRFCAKNIWDDGAKHCLHLFGSNVPIADAADQFCEKSLVLETRRSGFTE
jgi:hypothetical protein